MQLDITKTCPCNVYPFEPHFDIAIIGYAEVYLFFSFLLQDIDCGYSLGLPLQGGFNVYPQSMFSAKIRKYQNVSDDISFFTTKKSLCILHGQVVVGLETGLSILNMGHI